MKKDEADRKALELLAFTLGNFAAISAGVGIYDKNVMGLLLGAYSMWLALKLIRRAAK